MPGSLADIVLIILVVVFAVIGYRQGFFVGLLSFVGFFGGAAAGLQLGPWFASHVSAEVARVFISLLTVFGLAIAGQAIAGRLGDRIKAAIRNPVARTLEHAGGAVVSVAALLLVAWLVAAPLGSSALPVLARSVRNSEILHGIDQMLPGQAQALSDALRRTVDTRGFPNVFGELSPTRVRQVPPPDPSLSSAGAVAVASRSVVKVLGTAPSCARRIEGSGFVYARRHVLTNAHVVAGTRSVSVDVRGELLPARVVLYDAERDLAVLYVPRLSGPVLHFAGVAADTGDDAVVLGYPLDGPFDAQPARIRDKGPIRGPDIYASATVTRDIYTIRGLVRSGNSGGPLIRPDGAVLGVVFAAAADDPQTGFALSAAEVAPDADQGRNATAAADTGSCTSD